MNDQLKKALALTLSGGMSRRAFMQRAAALGVTVAAANMLLAQGAQAQEAKKGGKLIAGMQGGESTNSLDPALAASEVPFAINRTWGETLVDVDAKGQLEMRMAEEVTSSPDAKVWTFKIRKGVKFHNGAEMTPADIVATIERHSDEKSQSGAAGIMKGIASTAIDGDNVVVTLTDPNADLPYLMADYHLIIQPNGGKDDPVAGIGTGAYKVKSFEPGVRATFEKFADYWDTTRGFVDEAEIVVINDSTARIAALQSGQVHMINRVDPKVIDLVKRAPGVTIHNAAGRGHYVFIMRCDAKPVDNNDLRMALKYAINRQELVDKILGGYGSIGNDTPINAAYPFFDETIEQREYDPVKAAEYYKKSGHDGSPIILDVAPGAFPGAVEAAQLFQESAKAAGIPLEIKRNPDDGYWSDIWNKAPFCASYWGGRPVQDQMYSTAYLSTAEWNDTAFKNEKFDALLMQARGELDPAKRKALYSEMAHIVRDEGGLICPMFNDFVDAASDKVGGYEADPNGEMMDGAALVKCWVA